MIKKELKITLVQTTLHWEDRQKNLADLTNKISGIEEETDLVILPEMFTTGFTMKSSELFETMDGATVRWMKEMAERKKCAIAGSVIIKETGCYYNRFLFVGQDGNIETYDKRHLFRMAGEDKYFSKGNGRVIIDYGGWKICPMVCYDLRFPVWDRSRNDRDLMIFVANWPETRKEAWSTLLRARAMENQVYVAGVNRVGKDGSYVSYSGNSAVFSPSGNLISNIRPGEESIQTVILSMTEMNDFREKFPAWLDADDFEIK